MNICLMGFTDKRPVVYSLLKVLGQAGRTLFVTSNLQYSQLSEHYEQDFEAIGVRIICEPISFGEILAEIDLEEYNYIIFDCLVEVPEKVDVVLIQDNLDYYRDLLDRADDESYRLFINKAITSDKVNAYTMVSAAALEKTCRRIERERLPYPFTSSAHNKMMAALLGEILRMPSANLIKYLKRGVEVD